MALYIRDEAVDALAKEVLAATGAENKTEAVREALKARLASVRTQKTLREHVQEIRQLADTIGDVDPNFDLKKFSDDMWGET